MSFEHKHWIYQKVHSLCNDKFYYKYSDAIYKVLSEEYLMVFDEVTEEDIKHVVQEFKDFFGEEE